MKSNDILTLFIIIAGVEFVTIVNLVEEIERKEDTLKKVFNIVKK